MSQAKACLLILFIVSFTRIHFMKSQFINSFMDYLWWNLRSHCHPQGHLDFLLHCLQRVLGVSVVAQRVINPTCMHEVEALIPGLAQWVKDLVLL